MGEGAAEAVSVSGDRSGFGASRPEAAEKQDDPDSQRGGIVASDEGRGTPPSGSGNCGAGRRKVRYRPGKMAVQKARHSVYCAVYWGVSLERGEGERMSDLTQRALSDASAS